MFNVGIFMKDKPKIVEVAIPAAIRVKDKILDIRDTTADLIGTIVFRNAYKKDTEREVADLKGSIIVLYQHIKKKFPKNHKIHELDNIAKENKEVSFDNLYDYFDMIIQKLEDLKITKIERKQVPQEESWG